MSLNHGTEGFEPRDCHFAAGHAGTALSPLVRVGIWTSLADELLGR